ncbi:MAG: DNA-directed RNA polymerase specialized sigma24 family protein [Colwellia sp.]
MFIEVSFANYQKNSIETSRLLAWCQAHHQWLMSWLIRCISCYAQAADLTQDTFGRLLTKPITQQIIEPI